MEEHERLNGRYVHQEFNPKVIAKKAAQKAKDEALAKAAKAKEEADEKEKARMAKKIETPLVERKNKM